MSRRCLLSGTIKDFGENWNAPADGHNSLRRSRYESIHKAAQYKNSGAIQIAIMSESDGITMGITEGFQCSRRQRASKGDVRQDHYPMPKKVRPLHETIVKVSQRASGQCVLEK
jgi:hypothetical protein